jgi:hypothetical protein
LLLAAVVVVVADMAGVEVRGGIELLHLFLFLQEQHT